MHQISIQFAGQRAAPHFTASAKYASLVRMPELPEVENVRLSLEGLGALGQRFNLVKLFSPALRTPLRKELSRRLPGQTLLQIKRRAKFLLLETENFCLVNHLGMTGSWRQIRSEEEVRKHDHVLFEFASGMRWVYNDPRRFGLLEMLPRDGYERYSGLRALGPEPLENLFNGEYLFRITRGLKSSIKSAIMDQKKVVGVGNIYASEALFRAGIRPTRRAGKLTLVEAQKLVSAIRHILKNAISAGGSTIRDYKNSNGEDGNFQKQFQVYGRAGESCVMCSEPVRSRFIGGRNSFWCNQCQR